MITAGIARLLSAPLARAEALDPGAATRRARLAPTSLAVEASDWGWSVTLYVGSDGSQIFPGRDASAAVTLVGPVAALLALAAEPERPLPGSGVRVYGSPGQLAEVVKYLRSLRPDWAELIERALGPLPAAGATASANAGRDWLRRAALPATVADYMTYEAQLTVSDADSRDLAGQLAETRARVDRLDARLDAIARSAPSTQE